MAVVTICSDFVAEENKICHCFHFFLFYLLCSDGTRCHDLSFTNIYLHLVCSHIMVIVKNATVILWMHISFQVSFFVFFLHQYSEIQLLAYDNSTVNFLRDLHSVFHSGCTLLTAVHKSSLFSASL